MTGSPDNRTLTRRKLSRLIELCREHSTAPQSPVDATDFDWSRPHHFSREQLANLGLLAKKTEERIAETFETLCQGPFEVTAEKTTQHFASTLAAGVASDQPNHYFLVLTGRDGNHCGFMSFSLETAHMLVALMLRESAQVGEDVPKLSSLQDSILMDIAGAVAGSFTGELARWGVDGIVASENFIKGNWPVSFEGLEDLTMFTFTVKCPADTPQIFFTVLSTVVDSALGCPRDEGSQPTTQEVANQVMANVHKVGVEVTARLSSAFIELDDIMNISPGDVLLLPNKIGDPCEILLNQKVCFKGYPATCRGKYAVVLSAQEEQ